MKVHPQQVYGVEFSRGLMTVVCTRNRRGRADSSVLACGMNPAKDPAWTGIAGKIRQEQERGTARVASAIFAHDSFIRPVEAPFASIKKARAVFPSLLDVQLPFPLEQCVYGFAGIRCPPGGNVRSLAFAVPRGRMDETLNAIQSTGLDPEWMEQEAMALWRYSQTKNRSASGGPRVILYLGMDRTVVVVGTNEAPLTSLGTRMAWSPAMEHATEDKLVLRLQQYLAGALRSGQDNAVEFLVSGPAVPGSEHLCARLGVDAGNWRITDQPESYLAHALADGALYPDAWSENIRMGELEHPNLIQFRERVKNRQVAAVILSSLLLILSSLGSVTLVSRHHDALQLSVRQTAVELTGMEYLPRGQELFLARKEVQSSGEKYRAFGSWLEPSAYPYVERILRAAALVDVKLEVLSVRPASVLIRGSGGDWNVPDLIAKPLSSQGWKVEAERKDAGTDERVHFTVRAQP